MTKISEIIKVLEAVAPPMYQEDYDNSGLLIGKPETRVSGVLLSLDVTEEVVREAVEIGCNLIIAHHPLIFKGLKRITENHWIGRCTGLAIKNDIAVYAIHTNLDNVLTNGVNGKIAEKIGLDSTRVLVPKSGLLHFEILTPGLLKREVKEEVIGFNPLELIEYPFSYSLPFNGAVPEIKLEGIVLPHQKFSIKNLAEKYNLRAIFSQKDVHHPDWGAGVIGELVLPMPEKDFLEYLKEQMNTPLIRHTRLLGKSVNKVAVCGGSGSGFLSAAKSAGADVYITGDFKYHEFFEADGQLVIADIGHFESEQFTTELLFEIISNNFSTFALHYTKVNTNPVNYF